MPSINRPGQKINLKKKRTTIRDVAKASGLSPTAVSRHLNGDIVLPNASASRIDKAIRRLDYQPNFLARNLSLGKSLMIGLVLPDISNPFFATLACAVEDAAFESGYTVLLCNTKNDRVRELSYLRLLDSQQLDGILFLTSYAGDPAVVEMLGKRENVIIVDEDIPGVRAGRVFCENERGGYLATRHLLDHGHRRIAFIGGPNALLSTRERYQGFCTALNEAGLKPLKRLVRFGPYANEFGRDATKLFLGGVNPPTAIFASSDYTALGVLSAIEACGKSVPKDISLVGFDDMPMSEFLHPPLSTIRQPMRELGTESTRLLLRMIRGEETGLPVIRLGVELIQRQSVAEPRL
jgi:LacI family transcriptional regulator